jgi:4-amino-4-deoxy-L-arabinose transferase-like glycosyltransferase
LSCAGFLTLCVAERPRDLLFLLGWGLASMVGVSASGYFFPHYFQQLLPVLALTAALGARGVYDWVFLNAVPPKARALAIGLALAALPVATLAPYLFSYTPAEAVRKIYPGNFFAEMPALGARVAELTGPDERVFIFGAEPEVLFYARRVSATRYIFLFPLYGPYHDALAKQAEAADEVLRNRPAAAVYLPNNLFTIPGSEQYFTRWSRQYLEASFRSDTYLTVDPSGAPRLITGAGGGQPPLPAGHRLIGAALARKETP